MIDFNDIAATIANRRRNRCQHARLVRYINPQAGNPTIDSHIAIEDRGQQAGVYIAAADHHANPFSGKQTVMGVKRGNAGSARPLGNDALLFDKRAGPPIRGRVH